MLRVRDVCARMLLRVLDVCAHSSIATRDSVALCSLFPSRFVHCTDDSPDPCTEYEVRTSFHLHEVDSPAGEGVLTIPL